MKFTFEEMLLRVVLAVVGGLGYVFFWRVYEDLEETARHLALATIAGVSYE